MKSSEMDNKAIDQFDIVLASASERRAALLKEAGLTFRTYPVDVDESIDERLLDEPLEAAKYLAEKKAKAAVEQLVTEDYRGLLVVIASDTMVVLRGEIFGKPKDADHAHEMLSALSGVGHDVHTAVSVWFVNACGEGDSVGLYYRTFVETTYVYFRELSETQIRNYIATGDPFDKAGAYGIQNIEDDFVDHIEGDRNTVIGFPVARLALEFPDLFNVKDHDED